MADVIDLITDDNPNAGIQLSEAYPTNVTCFIATGRGLMRVGDSAKAARLALEQRIREMLASTSEKKKLTDEKTRIRGWCPIYTVGYVWLGEEEDAEAI